MDDVQTDIETLVGELGLMTHQLPNACDAMEPWLRGRLPDARFWDGKFDPSHDQEIEIEPMTQDEQAEFWGRYAALPSAFSLIGTKNKQATD